MAIIKSSTSSPGIRGEKLRQHVLDAAERLLRAGNAAFSMRDLAAEAGVSFATPFNQFGSKAEIMRALSERRIDTMIERFGEVPLLSAAADRVLLATDIGVGVMLEEPAANRTVMGWIGTQSASAGQVLSHSTALWAAAIGAGEGLIEARRDQAVRVLPRQLAFAFRGVLSFWTAGELSDEALATEAHEVARTILAGVLVASNDC